MNNNPTNNLAEPEITKSWRGWIFALASAISTGFFVISFKLLNQETEHFTGTFAVLFASLVMYTFSVGIKRRAWGHRNKTSALIIVIVAGTILGNLSAFMSLDSLLPALLQVVQRTEILFTILLVGIFLKEKINFATYFSAATVILGIVLINYEKTSFDLDSWTPILLSIGSGFSFAVLQVANKVLLKNYTPLTLNFYRLLCTCIVMLLLIPEITNQIFSISANAWMWAVICAFCGPFLGRLFYTYSVIYIDVSKAALVTALSPIFSLSFQWIFLREWVSTLQIIGGTIIIMSIMGVMYINQHKSRKNRS